MKTLLTRMKTVALGAKSAGTGLTYVQSVEIIHPEIVMTSFSRSLMPMICFTPIRSSEQWDASQRKVVEHRVAAYLMMAYNQRELSIMGDSTRPQGQGIEDFINDFLSIYRGHRFSVAGDLYLDKPLDIENVDHIMDSVGENQFILVAEITLVATRLFLQTTLPGDI